MLKNILTKKAILLPLLAVCLFLPANFVQALFLDDANYITDEYYESDVFAADFQTGKDFSVFNDEMSLKLIASSTITANLPTSSTLGLIKINESVDLPWNLRKISGVYQFDFSSDDLRASTTVKLKYQDKVGNGEYKQIFYFDRQNKNWHPLPTKDDYKNRVVSAELNLNSARLAVFSYPEILSEGRASWYKYKGGNFTASPDFPKGSKLRVYNLANGKFVDVTVNDFGPERKLFPDRVVDLDKVAFSKIASVRSGTIKVRIEPLYVPADRYGRVLNIFPNGASITPDVEALSGIVMKESTGEIIWEKNSETARPLASLTKLLTVKVFLDTADNKNRLNEVVKYKGQDEKYNYQYCNEWESASLNLKDGDELTIKDLIYATLVHSTNNTTEALVRVSGLSRPEFIKRMNETARKLGANNANFVEPTGLSEKNVISAKDYAIIAREAMKEKIIKDASSTGKYSFRLKNKNNTKLFSFYNSSSIVRYSSWNVAGSKTGYLNEAGYCLFTRVKVGNDYLIVVTMNHKTRDLSFLETTELIRYGWRLIDPAK